MQKEKTVANIEPCVIPKKLKKGKQDVVYICCFLNIMVKIRGTIKDFFTKPFWTTRAIIVFKRTSPLQAFRNYNVYC